MKGHLQRLTTSKGSKRPVQAPFLCLRHRQPQRGVGDLLAGTPVLGAAPGDGGGGDEHCGAGEYLGVRGGNVCARGKSYHLERVCDSPLLPESPSVLGLGAPAQTQGEEQLRKLALENHVEVQMEEGPL